MDYVLITAPRAPLPRTFIRNRNCSSRWISVLRPMTSCRRRTNMSFLAPRRSCLHLFRSYCA